MNSLKIVIINHEYPPYGGGGAVYTKYLVETLAKNNLVYLITIQNEAEKPIVRTGNIIKIGIPVNRKSNKEINTFAGVLFVLRTAFFLEEFLESNEVDIIHTQFSLISGLSVRMIYNIIKKKNIKFIVTCLGADIYEPTRFKGFRFIFNTINKWVLKKADSITVPSEDMKKRIFKLNKKLNVQKINLGIDMLKFNKLDKDQCRDELNIEKSSFVLVTVCRLVKRKNLPETLKIFKKLSEKLRNISLIIVGDGPERLKIDNYIKKNNFEDKIFLKGDVGLKELNKIYGASDIFYTNSFHESFGLVYVESMASGCPVLSTYNGGAEEIIIDGENGYLLKNSQEFIDKIKYLFNNREKLLEIGKNALFIKEKFNYQLMVKKFIKTYYNLLKE